MVMKKFLRFKFPKVLTSLTFSCTFFLLEISPNPLVCSSALNAAFQTLHRGHPLSAYTKFSEKLIFLTPWYAHVHVGIRGLEMLVFRKILRTYLMDGPTHTPNRCWRPQKNWLKPFSKCIQEYIRDIFCL